MKLSVDMHLPFKLPIKEGINHVSGYEDLDLMFTFKSYQRQTVINEKYLLDEMECTLVKIDYMPHDSYIDGMKMDEVLRLMVLDSIEFLNRFFDALRINFGLSNIYNITINDLPIVLDIEIDDNSVYQYLTRPQDVVAPGELITIEKLSAVGSSLQMLDMYPTIFLFEKFFANAQTHLYKQEMIEAVIDLQTSFEIFIRNTHKLLLLHNRANQDELNKAATIAFRNVIEDHLGRYLGVSMKFNDPSGPISDWYKNLYMIRNEIIHSGRLHVTGEEGYKAFDVYVNARNYITDLLDTAGILNENKKVDISIFPKNTKGMIDPKPIIERLQERGLISKEVKYLNSSGDETEESLDKDE
ncbi:hypothetical protein NSQ90_16015 [Paenibacillus sp. FSL H7-0737]|uniref:hypothetical protein n=1 Tax=Paenibacillus sp. FSL H7-0737 TaxID=1536775 RepID=UPI0004F67B03|nr:hypothetical protein [Paenibacillus sp. FSL H7-0737]AIQ24256.1 hypothetical protein H70737_16155 [Paenibacillus sp. FSL H7-0737]